MSSARVVVLGGSGAMGRIIVRDLARTARGVETVVADRDLGPARPLAKLRGVRLETVDVLDPRSLARVLRGARVAIASLPYRFNLDAMRGALAAGADYVDLGGLFHVTREQLALRGDFEKAGLRALLGMGSAPGIVNVLAALAARDLDRVREVHCQVGSRDATRYREAPPLGFGYSPDTLLDEFTKPSAVYRNGRFLMVPPLDPRERVAVRFPAPVGKLVLDTTLHSEVATLPAFFRERGVREVTFRQGFDEGFADKLVFLASLGLADTAPLDGAGISPRAVLAKLLARFPAARPIGGSARYEILRAVVSGTRGKRSATVTADCHAGPDAGWGIGPDIDTGAPPSIAAQMLLSGEISASPGVWAPEEVVPPDALVRELAVRGMKVHVSRSGVARTGKRD